MRFGDLELGTIFLTIEKAKKMALSLNYNLIVDFLSIDEEPQDVINIHSYHQILLDSMNKKLLLIPMAIISRKEHEIFFVHVNNILSKIMPTKLFYNFENAYLWIKEQSYVSENNTDIKDNL